jgi:hypothetical protein
MNPSAAQIRFFHALVFIVLMACLAYALYSAINDRITPWTWIAIGLIFVEGLILLYFKWQCPLTTWAENRGAKNGAVADLFLPKALADRLFPIYGVVYAVTVALIFLRWLVK